MKNNTQRGRRGLLKPSVLLLSSVYASCSYAGGESQIIIENGVVERAYIDPSVVNMTGRPSTSNQPNHRVYYTDGEGKMGVFYCRVLEKNDVPSSQLPTDRTDPEWVRYSAKASRILDECPVWKAEQHADHSDIRTIGAFISDGHYAGSGLNTGISIANLSVAPTPTSCKAQILSHMNFGTVMDHDPGASSPAIARIEVECNKQSGIDFTVNKGRPMVNEDGSKIIFSIWSPGDAPAGVPTEIQVRGTMLSSPSKPGSYQWYVPILFSYE